VTEEARLTGSMKRTGRDAGDLAAEGRHGVVMHGVARDDPEG
jgi:hypothetical protein